MSLLSKIKQTVQLALPIVVGELGVMLMGLADTIQVGQMSTGATESLGAAGMAQSIFFTIAVIGIICLAGGLQGWFIEKTKIFERVIMVVSGVALAYPSTEADLVGFIGFGLVLVTQTITHFKLNPRSSA